jgi:hypothetical protein
VGSSGRAGTALRIIRNPAPLNGRSTSAEVRTVPLVLQLTLTSVRATEQTISYCLTNAAKRSGRLNAIRIGLA